MTENNTHILSPRDDRAGFLNLVKMTAQNVAVYQAINPIFTEQFEACARACRAARGLSMSYDTKGLNQDGERAAYEAQLKRNMIRVLKAHWRQKIDDLWRRQAVDRIRQANKRTILMYGLVSIESDAPNEITITVRMDGREDYSLRWMLPNGARASFA